jgi:hypothetical protein
MKTSFMLPLMLKPKGNPVYITAKNGKTRKVACLTVYGRSEKWVRDQIRQLFEQLDNESKPVADQTVAT